jgi:hypothetical protein
MIGIHNQLPPNRTLVLIVLVVVLGWERFAFIRCDLSPASHAPIYSRSRRRPTGPAQLLESWSKMNVACHLDARHDGLCTGSALEHHLVRDIAAVSTSSEVQTSRRRCRITDDFGRSPTWIIRTPTGHTSKRPQPISGAFCRSLISLQIWLRGTATITPHDFHR